MKSIPRLLAVFAFLLTVGSISAGESLTFRQVLQRVLGTDLSLQVAAMKVQRARQENPRVESQLGWALEGQAGVGRDTSPLLGTRVDRADASASLDRKLASGGSVGLLQSGDGALVGMSGGIVSSMGVYGSSVMRIYDGQIGRLAVGDCSGGSCASSRARKNIRRRNS
jgi:hypothetical protein